MLGRVTGRMPNRQHHQITTDEARRIANNIAKLGPLLIERGKPHEPFTAVPSNLYPFRGPRRLGTPRPIRRCRYSGSKRKQL
jgi:hypothetical protein